MKVIGVLTSGGDAPGMNAAVRAVVRTGLSAGLAVLGIQRGYRGLVEGDIAPMSARTVSNIIQRGGTIIKTARCDEFMTRPGRAKAIRQIGIHGIEGLVLIGGDGTFRGAIKLLNEWGGKAVGVPGTIDNDLYGTDYTIGFDTAVDTALRAIDKVRDTAAAHDRTFLVEVMGRHAGFIALHVGVASGAEVILIPETRTSTKALAEHLAADRARGKTSSIVVVAEGDEEGGVLKLGAELRERYGIEAHSCVLGHIQRGGSPTASDRLLGSRLGGYAVELLRRGKSGVMAGEINHKLVAVSFAQAVGRRKPIGKDLVKLATILAT